MKDDVVQCHQGYWFHIRGAITAKIKFGTLLCFLPMRFLMFSLVFLMVGIVLKVFLVMFATSSLLFCFCFRLFRFELCLCQSGCFAANLIS